MRISYDGRVVATVSGRAGERLAAALETARTGGNRAVPDSAPAADPRRDMAVQLLLAKATGNFKRGNER